ncbi:hypothetical protein DL96DRAFT_1609514, partial [Flagelloscypha sp. PMI_526]
MIMPLALPAEIEHHIITSLFPDISLLDPSVPVPFEEKDKALVSSLDSYHYFATTFQRTLLVCKNWALIAQSIFYRTLVFYSEAQIFKLASTLELWAPDYTQSPLRHVRGIHIGVEIDQFRLEKILTIAQRVREATQNLVSSETVVLGHLKAYRLVPIPWPRLEEVLSDMLATSSSILAKLCFPTFFHAVQMLHLECSNFAVVNDERTPPCLVFPSLRELHISVETLEEFPPVHWSIPALTSLTISGWGAGWAAGDPLPAINFLPFLQKYGAQIDHFFLYSVSQYRRRTLSSSLSPELLQQCLDALPELKHLVLTQMPWKDFENLDEEGATKFFHPNLAWIDYAVVPSAANFLNEDKAEFNPTTPAPLSFASSDVPRIRGGARTKQVPRWGHGEALVSKLRVPGPVPLGWGSGLPNLQGLRKVDFSLFPLMPALTRDILPPVLNRSDTWIPFSNDAVIRETKGRVYLWIHNESLRERLYREWALDSSDLVRSQYPL